MRYDVGAFTMCCFPPGVAREDIAEVLVYGVQALDEN